MANLLGWLSSNAKKVVDQINPLDNGRTFQHPTPTNNNSAIHQLTHNGLTNTVGNMVVKPAANAAQTVAEVPRMAAAAITYNTAARQAAQHRFIQDLTSPNSAANFIGSNISNAAQAGANLAFRAPIEDLLGHSKQADAARTMGLKQFNQTAPGSLVRPIEEGIANIAHASKSSKAAVGLDPNATGAQKYFADPVMGALATYGLAKAPLGVEKTVKAGADVLKPNAPLTEAGAVGKNITQPKAAKPTIPKGQVPLDLAKNGDTPSVPGAFKRAFQSTAKVVSQYGAAGKEIANRLGEHRFQSEVGQEKFLSSIPSVGKLNPEDFSNFVDTLDARSRGERPQMAPHIKQAVTEWNKAIPSIVKRARNAGIQVGDLGKNYFPRVYKDLFSGEKNMSDMAQKMVAAGKATDTGDAMGKLRFMQKDYAKTHGNLERTRALDMPGYEKTHDALTGYVARAFDRITKAEQFGPNGEVINRAYEHMAKDGYNAGPGTTVDKALKTALGNENKNTTGYKASAAVRKFNALRSLNTAGISNATQLTNTATIAGIGRTLKGIAKTLDPVSQRGKDARASARAAGVELDHTINNLSAGQLGVRGKVLKNIASPFFHTVEKFNRTATAVVGKDYGNHLAEKAAKGDKGALKTLQKDFGIRGKIGSKLTPDQELRMSSKLVEKSQFKVDPQDLPGWVDSPMGKLAAQFRTFGYKQTGFMYHEVLKKALAGDFKPLARFIAVGVPAGSASIALKGAIKGQPVISSTPAGQVAGSLAAVGGGGLPGSEAQNIANGFKYNDPVGALTSTVGGPTASFIAETGKNITTGMKQGNWHNLGKEGVRSVPVVGPAVAGHFLKGAAQPKAVTPQNIGTASVADIAAQDSKETAAFKKANQGGEGTYGLSQLTSGKYIYKVGNEVKTTTSLKTAGDAIRKDAFSKSGEAYQVIPNVAGGGVVMRRAADGSVTETTKTKFDYQLGTAELTFQKNNGDLAGWMKTAQGQLDSIDKQLKDPSIDPLDALQLQNDATAIMKNMDKYTSYGGFTKGSSSGSSGSSTKKVAFSTTGFKTASASTNSVSAPKGVSVRKLAAPTFKSSLRKQSVAKIPTNYKSKKIG